jgi:hypothetical protein
MATACNRSANPQRPWPKKILKLTRFSVFKALTIFKALTVFKALIETEEPSFTAMDVFIVN